MRLNWTMTAPIGALAMFAVTLVGCATAEAPSVTMTSMTASFDEPDGAAMWFELTVVNTDTVDLPLAEARYSVSIGGRTVFRGVRSCEATAPARGVAVVRLPASAPDSAGVKPGDTVTIRGTLTYLTPSRLSEVLFDADIFRPEQGFTAGATIPASDE
jgi:hypothetical protein